MSLYSLVLSAEVTILEKHTTPFPKLKKQTKKHNRLVGKTRRWNSDLAKQMGATRTLLSRSLEADSTIGYNRNRKLCRRVQIHLKKHQGISKKQLAAR